MFPYNFPIDPWAMLNSTKLIGANISLLENESDILQQTKYKWKELDVTDITTLMFLGIIYLKSHRKGSKCLKIKSRLNFLCSAILKKCSRIHLMTFVTCMMQIMAGLFLHALTLPLVIPILLMFWIVSRVIKVLIWLQYGKTASKCEGMDAVWGLESPLSRPIITILIAMSGNPDIEKVRNHIKSKLVDAMDPFGEYKYRKFRQLFFRRYGYYIWQDHKDFDIKNHVTMVSINHNGWDKKNQILKYVSKTDTMAVVANRPPWHITVLDTGDGSYSLLILLHHAIGDGMSLVRLCLESFVDNPLSVMYPSPPKPHLLIQILVNLWSAVVLPLGMLKVITNNDKTSLHGAQLHGEKVVVSSVGLPLDLVRHVKRKSGATVNDVLMSCLASATNKLLTRRNEVCSQITAVIPVSFHKENEILKLHNCFSCGIVKLSTKPTVSPLARLCDTKTVFDKLKVDPTLASIYWSVAAVSDIIPAPIAEKLFTGKGITVAASNIPGPQEKLVIWDDTVEDLEFWVPNREPTGIGLSIISYRGTIKTSLIVDTSLIASEKEAQQFLDDFELEVYKLNEELEELEERYAHWSRYKTQLLVLKTILNNRI